MLQLERLNVVSETLKQLSDEMQDGKFDDNLEDLYQAVFDCRLNARRVFAFLDMKINKEALKEAMNEDS